MGSDDEDLDFNAWMANEGVVPLGGSHKVRPRPRVETSPERPTAKPAGAPPRTRPIPASTPSPAGMGPDARVLEAELLAARDRAIAQDAELKRLADGRDALARERDTLASELASARASRDDLKRQRDALLEQVTAPTEPPEAPPGFALADALDERGLREDERVEALAELLKTDSVRSLIDCLEAPDAGRLASILDRRLALICGASACKAPPHAHTMLVEAARCDVCAGSATKRAAGLFADGCAAAGISRVRIVGGSPAYRKQLEELFPSGGPIDLRVTDGDRRVALHRSKAQQRGDDLTIIWASTELDHATSGAYRSEFGRVVTIAHRGIGGMLTRASEEAVRGGDG